MIKIVKTHPRIPLKNAYIYPILHLHMLPRFDLHLHTTYSDGVATQKEMIDTITKKGVVLGGLSDHGPGLAVGIKKNRIEEMISGARVLQDQTDTKFLIGMEANIASDDGNLDIDDNIIRKLDFLIVGIHTLKTRRLDEMAKEYLARATNCILTHKPDILTHPFFYHSDLFPYLPSEEVRNFVKLLAERKVAIEINIKYKAPNIELLQMCLEEGVLLSIGSDAHRVAEAGEIGWALEVLEKIGATKDNLIVKKFL
ncbi:MAG: PHP domain-containing protein [Candidatus Hadarchaeales archaeon]